MIPQKNTPDVVPPFYKLHARKQTVKYGDRVWGYLRSGTGNRGCGVWGVGLVGSSMRGGLVVVFDRLDTFATATTRSMKPMTTTITTAPMIWVFRLA
jgi:hypothetical protein